MVKKVDQTAKAIIKKIKKGELKMKPKTYFVLGNVLLGVGIVGVMILGVFLMGAVFFHLRMQGGVEVLRFGRPGWRFLFRVLPWKIVGLVILGLGGGSYLIRKYDRAYKISLGWLILGIVSTILLLGFLFDRVGVSERMQRVRPMEPLYHLNYRAEDWLIGEVKEIGESKDWIKVMTPEGEEWEIKINQETRLPAKEIKTGDKVRIVGKMTGEGLVAEGVMPGEMMLEIGPRGPRGQEFESIK